MRIITKKGITSIGNENKHTLNLNQCRRSFFRGVVSGIVFPIITGIFIELYKEGKLSELLGYIINIFK